LKTKSLTKKNQILVTIMEIDVWFSWSVDLYMFNLNFVWLLYMSYDSQMKKRKMWSH